MAAAKEVEEKLKDITDCPICLETFKEPKILPCIHTFCMQCLRETGEKLSKNPRDTMSCPVCRKEFTVPETGFEGLQKNFFMDKLTEIKNILQPSTGHNVCDACREVDESHVEADMYCTECQQRLCSECFTHHKKYKLTKNHKTVTIKGCKSEDIQKTLETDLCEKHRSSLLEIYCSDCQEVVCPICFVENHKSHEGSYINKVDKEFRKQIKVSVDEFSSLLPRLRQEEQQLEIYRTELERCTEDMQTKINRRRQELKELVDKHADTLLVELDSINQQNLKKYELHKEEIETLLVSLESYNSYCLQLTTVGSASDICRAKTALDSRTKELRHLHVSSSTSFCQLSYMYVSLKITELQDGLRSPDQNIVGELNEHQRLTVGNSFERSPDNSNQDTKKSTNNTSQRDISGPTPIQEADEEDNEEFIECMEWNLEDCAITDPIELQCLSELETIMKLRLTEVEIDESSLHHKLKEVKQSMRSMLETIKILSSKLENKGVHLCEAEKEMDMLADRNKELELNEDKLSKMVEDLKCQVTLLRDLAHGGGEQEPKTTVRPTGGISCDEGSLTASTSLERLSINSRGIEVFGIAILENELFVVSNDNVTVIYDLSTLKFKRRWKVPREGKYDDIKQCNVNKCLYMMKVEPQMHRHNAIIRVDPNGNEVDAWPVVKSRGQLSVTSESNVLLTVSSANELHEYAPYGKLLEVIRIPWNSGIEKPSHAIKLTADHYLICHGKYKDVLVRVCVMERDGTVLKYFGELRKRDHFDYPIYLDIDGCGNILVADFIKSRVLLLSSDLTFKRILTTHQSRCYPKKVCFDKSYGRSSRGRAD